ncbi:hypothetical protein DSO57_1000939 [Entomophthora muscae]|uniref:Uncharacterized protein n=1 Tax=Entomophthora muscae TaxID=34485 RepID=A0ACC2TK69_9FUNG|nr:hypothetical protein DSO57_1000939 [Entomophthora muscae]
MVSLVGFVNANSRTWAQFVAIVGIVGNISSIIMLAMLAELFYLSRVGNYLLLACHIALALLSAYFLKGVLKKNHAIVKHFPTFLIVETVFATVEAVTLACLTVDNILDVQSQNEINYFAYYSQPTTTIVYYVVFLALSYVYMFFFYRNVKLYTVELK